MTNKKNTITLSDDQFKHEVLESKIPVLVDFWAAWCGPCRAIAPVLEDLAADIEGLAKVGKLDVDENPATAAANKISSIPTLLFFREGEIVDRVVGVVPKKVLREKIDALFQMETARL